MKYDLFGEIKSKLGEKIDESSVEKYKLLFGGIKFIPGTLIMNKCGINDVDRRFSVMTNYGYVFFSLNYDCRDEIYTIKDTHFQVNGIYYIILNVENNVNGTRFNYYCFDDEAVMFLQNMKKKQNCFLSKEDFDNAYIIPDVSGVGFLENNYEGDLMLYLRNEFEKQNKEAPQTYSRARKEYLKED